MPISYKKLGKCCSAATQGSHSGQPRTELVFPAATGGRRQWVSKTFRDTVNALGLNDTGEYVKNAKGEPAPVKITDARQRVVFHTLRHTYASWLVQKGFPLYTVAKLMGHSSLEMTQRYAHLSPDTVREAAFSLQGQLTAALEGAPKGEVEATAPAA